MSRLEFLDLEYFVKPQNSKEQLHVLKGVSGSINAGKLAAIMGSSGAGKSTLLDVLAMRKTVGSAHGCILLDGKPIPSKEKWKRMAGYVMQQDRLMSTATVFEALMFSKQLRTPYNTVSYAQQEQHVESILEEVGLSHRRDARIGGEEKRSLSGGETRRVSIAQELVADCSILFLDEPTSGLDSSSAKTIMELLRSIAAQNRIVAATIHQPSSQICALFDDLYLLGQGHMVYAGPWGATVPHFEALGYPCPQYTNPADFLLDLSRDETAFPTITKHAYDSILYSLNNESYSESAEEFPAQSLSGPAVHDSWLTPFHFQFRLLWRRSLQQWIRDPIILMSELVQYVLFGLLIGVLYYNVSDGAVNGTFDRTSAFFFILTTICFIPSYTVVTLAREGRPLQTRELSSGMYRVTANFLAKMCTTVPFEICLSLLFSVCCYFLIGFQLEAGHFFIFVVIVVIFQLSSETMGLICAATTPNPTIGVLLLSFILLIALAFGGFVVSEPRSFYIWFEKINFFVYAYTAATLNEFDGLTLYIDGEPVKAIDYLRAEGRLRNDLTLGENIAVMIAFLIGFRLFAWACLVWNATKSQFTLEPKKSRTLVSTVKSKTIESDDPSIVSQV